MSHIHSTTNFIHKGRNIESYHENLQLNLYGNNHPISIEEFDRRRSIQYRGKSPKRIVGVNINYLDNNIFNLSSRIVTSNPSNPQQIMYKSFVEHYQSPIKTQKMNIKPYSRKAEPKTFSLLRSEYENPIDNKFNSKNEHFDLLKPKSENKKSRNAKELISSNTVNNIGNFNSTNKKTGFESNENKKILLKSEALKQNFTEIPEKKINKKFINTQYHDKDENIEMDLQTQKEKIDNTNSKEINLEVKGKNNSINELNQTPKPLVHTIENKELNLNNHNNNIPHQDEEINEFEINKNKSQNLGRANEISQEFAVITPDITKNSSKKCVHCFNKEVTEIKKKEAEINSNSNSRISKKFNENTESNILELKLNGIKEVEGKIKEKFEKLEQLRKNIKQDTTKEIKKPIEENNYNFELYGKNHGQLLENQKEVQREKIRQKVYSNIKPQEKEKLNVLNATSPPIGEKPILNKQIELKKILEEQNEQNEQKEQTHQTFGTKNILNTSIDLLLTNNEKEAEKMNKKHKEDKFQLHKESLKMSENLIKRKENNAKEKRKERIHMEKSIEMFNKMKAEMEERRKNNATKLNTDLTKQIIEKKVKDNIEKESFNSFAIQNNKTKIVSTKMNTLITSKENPMVGLISPSSEQIIHEPVCKQCNKKVRHNL